MMRLKPEHKRELERIEAAMEDCRTRLLKHQAVVHGIIEETKRLRDDADKLTHAMRDQQEGDTADGQPDS